MTEKTKLIAAIMGYKRSTSAIRTFLMLGKNRISNAHCTLHREDGKFFNNGKRMTTRSALRHNARLVRFNLRQEYFMWRHPFALGAVYFSRF